MRKIVIAFIFVFFGLNIEAQPYLAWAHNTGSASAFPNPSDRGQTIGTDAAGNVYVAGIFVGTVDFDPGPGTYTLTAGFAFSQNSYLAKYSPFGNLIWVKQWGPPIFNNLFIHPSGIYTTGYYIGGIPDMDPGPGTYTLPVFNLQEIFVMKLDLNGNFLWANGIGGMDGDFGNSICADALGNCYATGYFTNLVDFDPGPGINNLNAGPGIANYDAFVTKMDAAGNMVWVQQIGSASGFAQGNSITLDPIGNVIFAGRFSSIHDFDPGIPTYTMDAAAGGGFAVKLNPSGGMIWARQFQGNPNCVVTDNSGNLVLGGAYTGTSDMDPGPGTYTLADLGQGDGFVAKWNSLGNFTWATALSSVNADNATYVDVDNVGDIYVCGSYSAYTVPFPPYFSSIFVNKYSSSGSTIWSSYIGTAEVNSGTGLALDPFNSILTTGYFYGVKDFDPTPGTYTLSASGDGDIFTYKLNQCVNSGIPVSITGNTITCNGSINIYSVAPVGGAISYVWSLPNGWIGTSTTNIITTTVSVSSGSIYVASYNGCALSAPQTLSVTVGGGNIAIAGSNSICSGNSATLTASGASTYTWNGGATTSTLAITPTVNTTYTVVGTIGSCTASAVKSVTVNSTPTISIAGSNSICSGANTTFTASGANTYTWNFGPTTATANVSPTVNTTYTVTGTSAQGCTNTAVKSLTVNPINVAIAGPSVICNGSSATFTASGANNYTWNVGPTTSTISVSPSVTTNYTVLGTTPAGCSNTAVKTLSVTNVAVSVVSSTNAICVGNSVTLTASGANNYLWNTGASTASINVTPSVNTSYTVTGIQNGCTGQTVTAITVYSLPVINAIANPTFICVGQNATLSANGAATYSWSPAIPMGGVVSPTSTISYTVAGTSSNNCTGPPAVITVSVDLCTSLSSEIFANEEINIYPNPSRGKFTLETNSIPEKILVFDVLGKEILSFIPQSINCEIDLGDKHNGLYFVQITNKSSIIYRQLVLSK